MYHRHVRQITFIATVVQDERQLDGSRHLEIVSEIEGSDTALHIVIDHDGELSEADMTLELGGEADSVALDGDPGMANWEILEFRLTSERMVVEARPRQDGDLEMRLAVRGVKP